MKLFLSTFLLIFVTGCHKPLTEPEEIDPIYREYMAEASNSEKAVEEQKKKIEEFMPQFGTIIPQTGQTKKIYNEYFRLKNELARLEQKTQYYSLAAKSRKYEARRKYLEAFEANKAESWPDPAEYEAFKVNKRVQNVDHDWRRRYPSAANGGASKKEAKKEGEGEHGGEH